MHRLLKNEYVISLCYVVLTSEVFFIICTEDVFCVTWLYHILTWSVLCNRFCFMYWHLKNSWTKYAVYVLFTICTVLCIDIWRIPEQHAVICIDIWRIREQHTLFFAFTHWHMKNSWTAYTGFCIDIWRITEQHTLFFAFTSEEFVSLSIPSCSRKLNLKQMSTIVHSYQT